MSTHDEAKALAKRAAELTAQHEKLFADHGLSIDVSDEILKRNDLGDDVRAQLEQELTSAREAARTEAFANARESRSGGHKPHSGMI